MPLARNTRVRKSLPCRGEQSGHCRSLGGAPRLREICHPHISRSTSSPKAARSGWPCGNVAPVPCFTATREPTEPSGSVRKHRRAKLNFHSLKGPWQQPRVGLTRTASPSLRPCAIFARLSTSPILPRLARTARCSQGPPEAGSYNLGSPVCPER